MAIITASDVQAVMDKLAAGEFIAIFMTKAADPPNDSDEVVFYPRDANEDGEPMTQAVVMQFLGGFLKVKPIPIKYIPNPNQSEYDPEGSIPELDENGDTIPAKTPLRHLVDTMNENYKDMSLYGLKQIAAESASAPIP